MIGLLSGIIRHKKAPHLLIECGGVGYEVEATLTAFTDLPAVNETATIYTHLSIRDDAHVLFGFATLDERDIFRILIKVNGIGPKMGIAILSGMNPQELAGVIAAEDSVALTRLPGIGKKTAERMVVELKDKFKHFSELPVADSATPTSSKIMQDAVEGLIVLGIKPQAAEKAVEAVYTPDSSVEAIIRQALKATMKR